jgi:hypothetical protein
MGTNKRRRQTQNSKLKGGATKKSRAGNLLIEANESKQESLNSKENRKLLLLLCSSISFFLFGMGI